MPPINATRQIGEAHAAFCDELTRFVQFASLSDRLGRLPLTQPLPESPHVIAFGSAPSLEEEVRGELGGCAARFAVLAMLTSVDGHLGRLLLLRRLAEDFASNGDGSEERRQRIAQAVAEEAGEGGLALLSRLVTGDKTPELEEAARWLSGLVRMKSALVRPLGTVTGEDLPAPDQPLRVAWRRTVGALDGNPLEGLPYALVAGQTLGYCFVERSRSWQAGERLHLSASDCHDIAISLSCLSLAVSNQLHDDLGLLLEA
jgi:hypothetical protein